MLGIKRYYRYDIDFYKLDKNHFSSEYLLRDFKEIKLAYWAGILFLIGLS